MFISVVIPVRNKKPHIARALNSVLAQNYEPMEVLVIDDNSSDGSMAEVEKFDDPRIRCLYRSEPGPGGYAARNAGIRAAKGAWVSFLDADDEWVVGHLHRTAEAIKANPHCEIFSSGWSVSQSDSAKVELDEYSRLNADRGSHHFGLIEYLRAARPIWTGVATVKKSLVNNVGGFDERWRHGADLQLWLKLLIHSPCPAFWICGRGAIYHRDSVNMVTSNLNQTFSPSAVYIHELIERDKVADKHISRQLKRYANRASLRPFLRYVSEHGADHTRVREQFFVKELSFIKVGAFLGLALLPNAAAKYAAHHLLNRSAAG